MPQNDESSPKPRRVRARVLLVLPVVLTVSVTACPGPSPNPDGGCTVQGNCDCGQTCACQGGVCVIQPADGGDGGSCQCEVV